MLSTIKGPEVGRDPPTCGAPAAIGILLCVFVRGDTEFGYDEKETWRLGPAWLCSLVVVLLSLIGEFIVSKDGDLPLFSTCLGFAAIF
jgi:hypothetical protein